MSPTEPTPPLTATESISRRRTTRRFDPDRPLSDVLLTRVLRLATLAPSGFNLQPWRFLVVRGGPNRRKLRACAFNHPALTEAPVTVVVLGYHTPDRSHLGATVDAARALGVVGPEGASEWRARASQAMLRVTDRASWASRTSAIAAATLMIAAESLGIASAWVEDVDPLKIKDAFGVPDDHTVCGLIALGYAVETPPFPGRFGLADVCYSEHFGQPWGPDGAVS